jgi:pentatricopeptide repeat protein
MAQTIIIERFIEKRDVDAALYLLGRMLSLDSRLRPEKKEQLLEMKHSLEHSHRITPVIRKAVIANYREVIG